ncbi:hypothetical protein D3C71_1964540 [compost metagenome]
MFPLVALLLVAIHGAEQAFKMVLQDELEVVHVRRMMHAAVHIVDLFTHLRIHLARRRAAVGIAFAGGLQVTLEGLQAFIELL